MGRVVVGESDLIRQQWVKDNLLEKVEQSFWSPYIGSDSNSIIQVQQTSTATAGHTVVFDYDAEIEAKIIQGMEHAFGKGVKRKKFSNKITVDRFTLPLANYNSFEGIEVGDLSITQHGESISKLGNAYIRVKDQMIFDKAQSAMVGATPTHIFNLGTNFGINSLADIEDALKTGYGFMKASASGAVTTLEADRRLPMSPFRTSDGENIYLFIVDSYMARKLKSDANYQTIMLHGDVRGNENRLIKSKIGKLGNLIIVEASDFFGTTEGAGAVEDFKDTLVTVAGLRKYSVTDGVVDNETELTAWEGQTKFIADRANDITSVFSRGLILGLGALQFGNGKNADYLFDDWDFGRESESALEFWSNVQKRVLKLESGEDFSTKIADIDYSIIAVDLKHV